MDTADAALIEAGSFWDEAVDEKTGKTYFFHIETDEVRWDKPLELEAYEQSRLADEPPWEEAIDDATGKPYYFHIETDEVCWDKPEELELFDKAKVWEEAVDDATGKSYYFHVDTDEVRWDKPPEVDAYEMFRKNNILDDNLSDCDGEDNGPLWEEVVDDATGKVYYFHVETDEVRWDKPPELVAWGDEKNAPEASESPNSSAESTTGSHVVPVEVESCETPTPIVNKVGTREILQSEESKATAGQQNQMAQQPQKLQKPQKQQKPQKLQKPGKLDLHSNLHLKHQHADMDTNTETRASNQSDTKNRASPKPNRKNNLHQNRQNGAGNKAPDTDSQEEDADLMRLKAKVREHRSLTQHGREMAVAALKAEETAKFYPYDMLVQMSDPDKVAKLNVDDIDMAHREFYLSDKEFKEVFGMIKSRFQAMPAWRQKKMKEKAKLL